MAAIRPLFFVAGLLLAATPAWAQHMTLGYDAFVAGAKVGAAEINIHTDDTRYRIDGKAWAVGVMDALTQWRSAFSSQGRIGHDGPVNEAYRFIERARDKVKELMLVNGQLTYLKNGQKRTPRPPTSLDVLSVMFLSRDCASAGSQLHNGKDPFSLKLTGQQLLKSSKDGATERCTFVLRDEHDERTDATVWIGQVDGLTVPVRLDLTGALEGTLKLHSPLPTPAAVAAQPADATTRI